jgi:hypothetical protein
MAYMEWRHQGVESSQTRFWRVLAYVLFITWMEISFYKNGATFWIHVFGFMSGLTLTAIFMNSTWKDLNATLKKSKLILAAWGVVLCALILVGVNTVSHCKQLNAEQLGQYGYYFFEAGDMNRSTLWYLKSAHAGDAESQEWVGREFAFGYNVPIDETVGRDWLKKAVAQGNAQAAQDLARLEASHENYDRALDWAEKAFILEKNPKTHAEIQIYIRKLELEKKTP